MKNALKFFILLMFPCCLWSCDKSDETPVSGHAQIIFLDDQKPVSLSIFTEDGNEIHTQPVSAGTVGFDLNTGNYKVQPYTEGGSSYVGCYFQIVAGRTTRITYDNHSATVRLE